MTANSWPPDFTIRPPQLEEAQQIADLICACDTADTGEPDWDVEETRADWSRLGFELERDARVVASPDGRILAYTDVFLRLNAVQIATNTCLDPDLRSPDLNAALLDLAESLAAQHAPLPVQWVISAKLGPVLEGRGYTAKRWLWRMRGELTDPPPTSEWPEGFGVRTMEPADERRVYELIEAAFVRTDRAPVTYEEWRRFIVEREGFDRSLAFVAVNGDAECGGAKRGGEIVGSAMCLLYDGGNEGWVRQLAVDGRYRGLGLGRALLLHAFGVFYHRGATRTGLGVDANNPSATKLYTGVGMYALQEYVQYQR